jgi:hypothetical protein
LQTTSSGQVKLTAELFSWYGSYDHWAKIEPPYCRQYKPGDFLVVRPLNSNEIIDKEDDNDNWADPRAPSDGRIRPSDGNYYEDGQGEEDTQGGEKGTGNVKGRKDGKTKGTGKATEEGKQTGMGNC